MNQPYVILEIAHSIHGKFQQIRLSHRVIKYFVACLLLLAITSAVLLCAFVRISWRADRYEQVQAQLQRLQARYQELQTVSRERREAVTSLANLATEVSAEYGITPPSGAGSSTTATDLKPMDSDTLQAPDVRESIEHFNFLKAADYSALYHRYAYQWQAHSEPSIWPVQGAIRSPFGGRSDPFSGEGAFHTGIDLQAATGTPVHVTADGVVVSAAWGGRYGNLVVVDHGNGYQTYYAHLSQFQVVAGEEVRLGQVIALSGGTGRATSPHLHYEVRVRQVPVNPYRFLATKSEIAQMPKAAHNDLGF